MTALAWSSAPSPRPRAEPEEGAPALRELLLANPLWRPVWGLWLDRRLVTSPLVQLLALLVLVFLSQTKFTQILGAWQGGTVAARTQDRWFYAVVLWWIRHGLEMGLLVFGLAILWRAHRSTGLAISLAGTPLTLTHVLAVALGPIAAIWAAAELAEWIEAIIVANRLADPGESLLWLIRRPGRITFLTDAVVSPAVVMSHNILAGSIALMGYAVYLLWWAWVLLALVTRAATLGRALAGLLVVCAAVTGLSSLIAHAQGMVSLVHPLAIWTFPPGTATHSAWRLSLASPLHHFTMYLTMHLGVLIVEMALVSALGRALERTQARLWRRLSGETAEG